MPTWLKVTIGVVGGGIALLLLLVCGGYLYYRAHKDEDFAAVKRSMEEGQAFGQNQTSEGCIEEGLRRIHGLSGMLDEVANNLWTSGCLETATVSPGFCDGVPDETEMIKTVSWRLGRCNEHAGVDPQRCQRFMQVWQKACHPSAEGPGSPLKR